MFQEGSKTLHEGEALALKALKPPSKPPSKPPFKGLKRDSSPSSSSALEASLQSPSSLPSSPSSPYKPLKPSTQMLENVRRILSCKRTLLLQKMAEEIDWLDRKFFTKLGEPCHVKATSVTLDPPIQSGVTAMFNVERPRRLVTIQSKPCKLLII